MKSIIKKSFWTVFIIIVLIVTLFVGKAIYNRVYEGVYEREVQIAAERFGVDPDELTKETIRDFQDESREKPSGKVAPNVKAAPLPAPQLIPDAILPNMVKMADPPGGHISDLAFAPSNPQVLYLASNVNAMGVWKSTNGGESWQRIFYDRNDLGTTHTNTVAVHPTDEHVVFASDLHGHIKKSIDGGTSFKDVYGGEDSPMAEDESGEEDEESIFALAISPSDPSVVYAGNDRGDILKSTDGGETWTTSAPKVSRWGIGSIAAASDPSIVYAIGRDGVYKSTDGGVRWQLKKLLREPVEVAVSTVSALEPAPEPAAAGPSLMGSISIIVAGSSGIYLSTDSGESWEKTLDQHAHSVQFAPSNSRIVYAGTQQGIYKSTNGGETWESMSSSIQNLDIGPIAIHPDDPDNALFGTNIWEWSFHGDPHRNAAGEGIYKTIDGGTSWVKTTNGFIDTDSIAVAVDYNNPNIAYLGTECSRGLFKTENGGASWTFAAGGPDNHRDIAHYSMRLATNKDSALFLTGRLGFGISKDGAATWKSAISRSHFHGLAVSPHDKNVMFTGTSSSEDATDSGVYGGGVLLRSIDGGRTWEEAGQNLGETSVHDFSFDAENPNIVYVSTAAHEFGLDPTEETVGVYRSDDKGNSWKEINDGLTTKEVEYVQASPSIAGVVFAGTEDGVFKSADYGDNWEKTSFTRHVHSLLIDPADTNILYAGTDTGLYWSSDQGEQWQKMQDVPDGEVHALSMDGKGTVLYAAVLDHGVWKGVKG